MDTLLRVALSNALVAASVAVVAAMAGRLCRRPALTHGLWLLVLLKLLTPPLITISFWPAPAETPVTLAEPPQQAEVVPSQPSPTPGPAAPLPLAKAQPLPPSPSIAEGISQATGCVPPADTWAEVLLVVWLAGTLAWSLLAVWRMAAFHRLLRFAEPAPAWLREEVAVLAGRLGLRRAPAVGLVPGRLAPMLWALGGPPRLLVPGGLLGSLTAEQRATLLLHELAHLRRRDHWVRALEMLTMALFWWHPVVWWARRELREAEELCCDAWVVWALPGAGRTYATALLECVDFLSHAPVPLPLGASGLGRTADLKRRLTMILRGNTPRRLTWGGSLALLLLGVLLLPAAFAQDRPRDGREPERRPDEPRREPGRRFADREEIDRARADVERLRRELEEHVRAVQMTEQRLREAARRLEKLAGRRGETPRFHPDKEIPRPRFTPRRPIPPDTPPPGGRTRPIREEERVRPEDRRILELERKLDAVVRQLEVLKQSMRGPRSGRDRPEGAPDRRP